MRARRNPVSDPGAHIVIGDALYALIAFSEWIFDQSSSASGENQEFCQAGSGKH